MDRAKQAGVDNINVVTQPYVEARR
jgi:hypothetical protein